jgi:hypothetical protein
MKRRAMLSIVVLVLIATGKSQKAENNPHDLSALVTTFGNYEKDFQAMEKASDSEFQMMEFLEQTALLAEDRIYAANAELKMYDAISCGSDRQKVKGILKDQLDYYVWVFDKEVTRTTGGLTFVKVPAAAQTGLQMKDQMRAAKEKLEAIRAGL